VFDLRVQLRTDEDGQAREVEPEKNDDNPTQRAVGLVVVAEVPEVQLQTERRRAPEEGREDGAGRDPDPVLFSVRREVVDQSNRGRDQREDNRPLQDPERPFEYRAQVHRVGEVFYQRRACDDKRDRGQDEERDPERQSDRDHPHSPERAVFRDVVRRIERADDRHHRAGAAPQCQQKREGQNAAVVAPRNLGDLIRDDRQHLRRCEPTEDSHDLVHHVVNGKEAGDGDERQECRKQRKEEIVGLLCCQIQQIVRDDLFGGPLRDFVPAQRHFEVRQHGCERSKRVARTRRTRSLSSCGGI
jgi:hypothetical protein